jgi:LemA protein
VNTVKGYASHEKDVLTQVTEARASVGKVDASAAPRNPEAFAQFEQAQQTMSGALSRLLVVSEQYPRLKADTTFRDLMAQLEGTENRIAVTRNRYIKAVQSFNVAVRTLPKSMIASWLGMTPKPNFTVENVNEVSKAPEVKF